MRSTLLSVSLVLAACGGPVRVSGAPGAPSDPEIMAMMQSTCQAEIMEGSPATAQSLSPDVQQFGQRLVNDETATLKYLQEMEDLQPVANSASRLIDAEAKQTLDMLRSLSGVEFDRQFMSHEVAIHSARIDLFAHSLLPYVDDSGLKSRITDEATQAQDHLMKAISVQRNSVH